MLPTTAILQAQRTDLPLFRVSVAAHVPHRLVIVAAEVADAVVTRACALVCLTGDALDWSLPG